MKDKYYSPEISEFHVGFEYEEKDREAYIKRITDNDFTFDAEVTRDEINERLLRVKYLDREDIESLGFKLLEKVTDQNVFEKEYGSDNNKIHIITGGGRRSMLLLVGNDDIPFVNWVVRFSGNIKNKSELKRILKQCTEN